MLQLMRNRVLTYIAITSMVTAILTNAVNVYAGTPTWITDILVSNANIERQQAESHIIASVRNNNHLVVALMNNSQDPDPNDTTYILGVEHTTLQMEVIHGLIEGSYHYLQAQL